MILREHEMLFLQQEKRIQELEDVLKPLLLEDTAGLKGMALQRAQFKNTVLKIIFPEYRKPLRYILGSRSQIHSLSNPKIFQNSIDKLKEIGRSAVSSDKNLSILAKNKIYIDVTRSLISSKITGIERVAIELAKAASRYGAVPVIAKDGQLIALDPVTYMPVSIQIRPDDVFLMPEGGWNETHYLSAIIEMVRRAGGINVTLLHDIIALYMPELCYPGVPERIHDWFHRCVLQSDAIICVSQSTAKDLTAYVKANDNLSWRKNLKIGWSLSGANELSTSEILSDRDEPPYFSSKFFLSVGSIEPRKAYSVALDAFERVWYEGCAATYVIVGRPGWNQEKLIDRIHQHKEYNKRLYLLIDIDDNILSKIYKKAHRLICPSIYEGFGLPIIEAAFHGLPSIVSDIPVFREVGGEDVDYFNVADHVQLANMISKAFDDQTRKTSLSYLTWDQSALNTLLMIQNSSYQIDGRNL